MPFSNPERAKEYQRQYRRLRRGGDVCTTPVHPDIPVEIRLKTASDVMGLLEEQVNAVRSDKKSGTLEKARTIGYLAGVTLKAIEAGNLAARIELLEQVMKRRNGKGAV